MSYAHGHPNSVAFVARGLGAEAKVPLLSNYALRATDACTPVRLCRALGVTKVEAEELMRRLACEAALVSVAALVLSSCAAGGSERTKPGKKDYGC